MATGTARPTIHFPHGYHERRELETPAKGWLGDVVVEFEDGPRYRLFFYDPVRLQQDLEAEAEGGRPLLAEPGLIVLPEVNTEAIRAAVERLAGEGFFEELKPVVDPNPNL